MSTRVRHDHRLRGFAVVIPLNTPIQYPTDYIYQTAKILQKRNLIILFDYQQTVSIARLISDIKLRHAFFVSYRTLIKKLEKGIIHIMPVGLIPFQRFSLIHALNILFGFYQFIILKFLFIHKPVVIWGFHPIMSTLLGKLRETFSVYDCLDYYGEEASIRQNTRAAERHVLQNAALTSFISSALQKVKIKQHPVIAGKTIIVPMGYDSLLFNKKQPVDPRLTSIPGPRIGFVGHLNYRIDFSLLETVVRLNRKYSFIFLGPVQTDTQEDRFSGTDGHIRELARYPNVYFLKEIPKRILPSFLNGMDVCIVPYNISYGSARLCSPMKAFEYLACGKPIVSTNIAALRELNVPGIRMGDKAGTFSATIRWFLKNWTHADSLTVKRKIQAYSWNRRVPCIENEIFHRVLLKHGIEGKY